MYMYGNGGGVYGDRGGVYGNGGGVYGNRGGVYGNGGGVYGNRGNGGQGYQVEEERERGVCSAIHTACTLLSDSTKATNLPLCHGNVASDPTQQPAHAVCVSSARSPQGSHCLTAPCPRKLSTCTST